MANVYRQKARLIVSGTGFHLYLSGNTPGFLRYPSLTRQGEKGLIRGNREFLINLLQMLIEDLKILFTRDLRKLHGEISAYQHEAAIWTIDKGILNSAGNLALHLVGNLNTYLGAVIGKSGYIRNRELEFSRKDLSRTELLQLIEDTIPVVVQALDQLGPADLEKEYPQLVFDAPTTMGYFLVHLSVHLGYHLGQINYHRRLLDA